MAGKPQGVLLEFKVSFSFFIIGLQAGEEVMLGGYNLQLCSVPYYTKHSIRICRNGVNSGGGGVSSSSFKRKSFSISEHHTHKNKMVPKDKMTKIKINFSCDWKRIGSCSLARRACYRTA